MISEILRILCIFTNVALIVVVTRANRSERAAVADLVKRTERLRILTMDGRAIYNIESLPTGSKEP